MIQLSGFLVFTMALGLLLSALCGGGSLEVSSSSPKNLCGPVGEAVVVFFWWWIGTVGTWGFIVLLAGHGAVLIGKHRLNLISLRAAGSILFCLSLATLEHLMSRQGGSYEGLPAGGIFGSALGTFAITHLSFIGAFIVTGLSIAVSLSLSTDVLFAPSESYFVRATRKGFFAAGGAARAGATAAGSSGRICGAFVSFLKKFRFGRNRDPETDAAPATPESLKKKPEELNQKSVQEEELGLRDPDYAYDEYEEEDEREEVEEDDAGREATIRDLPSKKRKSCKKGVGTRRRRGYTLPKLDLLERSTQKRESINRNILKTTAQKIEDTLQSFKIEGHVVENQRGPVITQYEVLLAPGIKVHRITNLASELAMTLKARRIQFVFARHSFT